MLVTRPVQRYTYSGYKNLEADDNFQYELINGEVVQKSAPSLRHRDVLMNLIRHADGYVLKNKLGKALCTPVDVLIDEYNAPEPDLLFIKTEHKQYITQDGVSGPPDLVVEILSPGSVTPDCIDKLRIYKGFGIPGYWIVDPSDESVEVYQLLEKEYGLYSFAIEKGSVQFTVLGNFVLCVEDVFAK